MLASHDWRQRHAGLMAIAAMAEGTSQVRPTHHLDLLSETKPFVQVMQRELGIVVEYVSCGYSLKIVINPRQISLVTPMFKDSHPRVKFAACQCM